MERVVIAKHMHGIASCIVCAAKDASDEEILGVANVENPSGTQGGWSEVIRGTKDGESRAPVPCDDHPEDRLHFIVNC